MLTTYQLASPLHQLDENDPSSRFITDALSTHAGKSRGRMTGLTIASGLTVIKNSPHPFVGKQVWFGEMVDTADACFSTILK